LLLDPILDNFALSDGICKTVRYMINMKTKAISKAKVDLPFAAIITA